VKEGQGRGAAEEEGAVVTVTWQAGSRQRRGADRWRSMSPSAGSFHGSSSAATNDAPRPPFPSGWRDERTGTAVGDGQIGVAAQSKIWRGVDRLGEKNSKNEDCSGEKGTGCFGQRK
jgi:hypothetical protein